ncbi:TPA: hypothetical protein JI037_03290 [Acinetobacter baumannii]|uniref:hypothetical protein n=4 Tax=Acinetobacter calcoaceticus/baumannii complex TaxID=909768 RepID=UPI001EE80A62|nr:hypothetical protein [Acinetobacter baumannii]MCG5955215.1 hypothetical protein [Acinetobacter baumannii]MDH2523268.1 hypothetical protein [Acinetobacter baumannii]HAV5323045.1 hypothetical protein [Acinetobacter baumannii]
MKHILHVVLTAISIALAGLIFLISHEENVWLVWDWVKYLISFLTGIENIKFTKDFLTESLTYIIYVIYLIILLILSFFSIKFSFKFLDQDVIERIKVKEFEQANDFYLPIYLGYAFVAISLPTLKSFLLFFVLMLVVLARTRFFYFNPIFLMLGYKFYFIKQIDDSKVLVISKKEIKTLDELFENSNGDIQDYITITKVNEYTFLILD